MKKIIIALLLSTPALFGFQDAPSLSKFTTSHESPKKWYHITGKVTDVLGNGLAGVNIVIKGTSTGTTTDSEGKYAINVDSEYQTLVYTYIGYITQEHLIGSRTVIDVILIEDVVE